jgi:hypothetical protein
MRRRKSAGRLPPFVAMTWIMLNSGAYKDLPPTASKMLPYFLGKVKEHPMSKTFYETTFTFPYSEGEALGCARKTFSEVVKGLMRNGFIDPVRKGGMRGDGLSNSVFKLSQRWQKYGRFDFEKIEWATFGQDQIRRQVQKSPKPEAKNEPKAV